MGTSGRIARDKVEALAGLAKVLSCPVRLEVLLALADGPSRVCALAARLELDSTLVSHHLRTLKDAGLVELDPSSSRHKYMLSGAASVAVAQDQLQLAAATGAVGLSLVDRNGRLPYAELKPRAVDRGRVPRSA